MFKRKGGGGSKAFWTMLKKTALFSRDGFPYCLVNEPVHHGSSSILLVHFWDTLYTSFAKKLMNDYHTTKVTIFIRPHTTQQSQKFKYRKKDQIEKIPELWSLSSSLGQNRACWTSRSEPTCRQAHPRRSPKTKLACNLTFKCVIFTIDNWLI